MTESSWISPRLRTPEGMKRFKFCLDQMRSRPCSGNEISLEVYGRRSPCPG